MSIRDICQMVYDTVDELVSGVGSFVDSAMNGKCFCVPAYAVPGYNAAGGTADKFGSLMQLADKSEDGGAGNAPSPENKGNAPKESLLMGKINSIMSAAEDEDDDEDDELLEELSKPKKKFFGLFG